ncbi:hypothetical protein ACFCXS_24850 [Streptomyces sp. NPDC056373]|uniref:hypothetical protein n=1 Tax=Streptomyces sp. NPDC056373 TaxID=3345798 RepID=UPI0035DCB9EC
MADIAWELQSNGHASFEAKGSHDVYNQSRTWVLERVALLNKTRVVEDSVDNWASPGRPYLLDMPSRNTQYSLHGSGLFDPKVFDRVVAMQMVVRWTA